MQTGGVRASVLAWVAAGLAIGLGLALTGLVIADAGSPGHVAGIEVPAAGASDALAETIMLTVFALIGGLVASRVPSNPVGWLLLATSLSFGTLVFFERLGWHFLIADGAVTGRVAWSLWVPNWAWIPAVVPVFIYLPQVFPTGRPLWPRFMRVALITAAVFLVASMLAPGKLENYKAIETPVGGPDAFTAIAGVTFVLVALSALASVGSLALRFRRSQGVERQQIKWMWAAGVVLVVSFVASGIVDGYNQDVADVLLLGGLIGIPVAVAVAILRYRLYDIAVVVNRTLVYGSLTATLAVAYLGSVLLLQGLLDPVTSGSSLAVAVSTLAVAALFRPLRSRIQAVVDRRFYRHKYDAARTLEDFSARLREELDLDSLTGELRGVLEETMQPAHVSVWLRPSGE